MTAGDKGKTFPLSAEGGKLHFLPSICSPQYPGNPFPPSPSLYRNISVCNCFLPCILSSSCPPPPTMFVYIYPPPIWSLTPLHTSPLPITLIFYSSLPLFHFFILQHCIVPQTPALIIAHPRQFSFLHHSNPHPSTTPILIPAPSTSSFLHHPHPHSCTIPILIPAPPPSTSILHFSHTHPRQSFIPAPYILIRSATPSSHLQPPPPHPHPPTCNTPHPIPAAPSCPHPCTTPS
jgi:hypothetical protein